MDISLNHFDVQLQVNNGQLQQANRYGVFSSELEKIYLFKNNQSCQTLDMDMGEGDHHTGKTNGYRNNDESYRKNYQKNGSSNNNGNQSNPNRNNNNSRR